MPLTKNIQWTIGGAENVAGTPVARTHVIPVRAQPNFTQKATRLEDPAIVGNRMPVGEFLAKLDASGTLPVSPRACPGYGKLLKSGLGLEVAPVQLGAVIRIRYSGAEDSLKLTADTSADTLNAKKGDIGSEVNDAVFGTAGTIDLTNASFNTVAELVAAIEAYVGYEAELVTGDGTTDSANIVSIVTQAKGRWAFLFFTGTSGAYLHTLYSDLTDTELPTYSVQGDGYTDGLLYAGYVADVMKHNAAMGGFLEADIDGLAFSETAGQSPAALTLEDRDPLLYWKGSSEIGGVDYDFISNHSFTVNNNHVKDTYGQGSAGRRYMQKAMLQITGDLQVRLDDDTYLLRAKQFDSSEILAASFMYKGKVIGGSVEEFMIVELPYIGITSPFDFTDRNGAFDAKVNFKAFNPKGTHYDLPIKVHLIMPESAVL